MEELCCDQCGTLLAFGSGDFNCTSIICVECMEDIEMKDSLGIPEVN